MKKTEKKQVLVEIPAEQLAEVSGGTRRTAGRRAG
jgi:hypothetical protein